jgi:hypothetical protein
MDLSDNHQEPPFILEWTKPAALLASLGALGHILMQLVFMFDLLDRSFKLLLACIDLWQTDAPPAQSLVVAL